VSHPSAGPVDLADHDTNPVTDPDAAPSAEPIEPLTGRNLLNLRWVRALVRSRWYPGVLQVPVAAVFGLVGFELLAGPQRAHDNPGTALMWVLWWPAIPIMFVFLGRFWCAVCPFGLISDVVQRLVGVERPVPRFLKRYGIWIIDAQFLLITWADHVWGIVESPWGSGVLLMLLTTAVIVSGAFFQRRTFCRYLCFLGGLCGNYARTGMVALRADTGICATCTARAACYNGTDTVAACPLFTFPRTMDSSAACSLCGNCVKSCPNDAIQITVRKPTRELWFVRSPKLEESFLAMAIMGIVLVQNVTMLSIWTDLLAWVQTTTGVSNYPVIFTVAFAVSVAAPVAALALASRVAAGRNLESTLANFTRFGYALIPLDVAGHLAHNLFHLLAEGKSVIYTVGGLFGATGPHGSTSLVSTPVIQALQFALIGLGALASLYAAQRLTWRRYRTPARRRTTLTPIAALVVALAAANVYLFTMPMAMRM
jgi:polyferredoxin